VVARAVPGAGGARGCVLVGRARLQRPERGSKSEQWRGSPFRSLDLSPTRSACARAVAVCAVARAGPRHGGARASSGGAVAASRGPQRSGKSCGAKAQAPPLTPAALGSLAGVAAVVPAHARRGGACAVPRAGLRRPHRDAAVDKAAVRERASPSTDSTDGRFPPPPASLARAAGGPRVGRVLAVLFACSRAGLRRTGAELHSLLKG
jgi:hypothetical protein